LGVPRLYRERGEFGFRVLDLDRAGSRVEALAVFLTASKRAGFSQALCEWLPRE